MPRMSGKDRWHKIQDIQASRRCLEQEVEMKRTIRCKFFRPTGAWDDDCMNKKSINYGSYDITGTPRLEEYCKDCKDYAADDDKERVSYKEEGAE